jgi:predicted ABC-type ATPase
MNQPVAPMSINDALILEAAKLHAKANKKQIAKEFTNLAEFKAEKHPVSVFMAGCAGAGKTETAIELIASFGTPTMRIDPDDLRKHFESYNGTNSWLFQYPVSILVDKIHDLALDQCQSFVMDGTLCDFARADHNISRSLKRGRTCIILFVYQKPELAWKFVQAREKVEGRRIAAEIFVEQFFQAVRVVNELKRKHGKKIRVDILIKNTDESPKIEFQNVDRIEESLHEAYDREGLLKLIKSGA